MYIPTISGDETLFGVYVALPAPYENFIRESRVLHGDTLASLCPTHITLLPPTPIKHVNLIDFITDLKHLLSNTLPFWITLKGISSFRPVSNVSYINVVRGGRELNILNEEILNFSAIDSKDKRFSFHPHVTIAHNVSDDISNVLEKKFKDFSGSFISSKVCVDILDTDGSSKTVAVLPLGSM